MVKGLGDEFFKLKLTRLWVRVENVKSDELRDFYCFASLDPSQYRRGPEIKSV